MVNQMKSRRLLRLLFLLPALACFGLTVAFFVEVSREINSATDAQIRDAIRVGTTIEEKRQEYADRAYLSPAAIIPLSLVAMGLGLTILALIPHAKPRAPKL